MALSARALARRVLAEPLTHFLIVGLIVFAGASAVKAAKRPALHIDRAEIAQLSAYWEAQMQRPPSKAELDGLVAERVDEEILAAEALRLGMDKGDLIIRRRLAQKMAFASEDVADAKPPSEAELRAFYTAHAQEYRVPGKVALRQVFFSGDRGPAAQGEASKALARLAMGEDPGGDPSVLPLTYAEVSIDDLARDYGPTFAKLAASAPEGAWQGPVQSGFGWHLVKIEGRQAPATEPYEAVRAEVLDAVTAERRQAANTGEMEKLRKRYRVEVARP